MTKLSDTESRLAAIRKGLGVTDEMIQKKAFANGTAAGDFLIRVEAYQRCSGAHQSRNDPELNRVLGALIAEDMPALLTRARAKLKEEEGKISEEIVVTAARIARLGGAS